MQIACGPELQLWTHKPSFHGSEATIFKYGSILRVSATNGGQAVVHVWRQELCAWILPQHEGDTAHVAFRIRVPGQDPLWPNLSHENLKRARHTPHDRMDVRVRAPRLCSGATWPDKIFVFLCGFCSYGVISALTLGAARVGVQDCVAEQRPAPLRRQADLRLLRQPLRRLSQAGATGAARTRTRASMERRTRRTWLVRVQAVASRSDMEGARNQTEESMAPDFQAPPLKRQLCITRPSLSTLSSSPRRLASSVCVQPGAAPLGGWPSTRFRELPSAPQDRASLACSVAPSWTGTTRTKPALLVFVCADAAPMCTSGLNVVRSENTRLGNHSGAEGEPMPGTPTSRSL